MTYSGKSLGAFCFQVFATDINAALSASVPLVIAVNSGIKPTPTPTPTPPAAINYLILGDSIAAGTDNGSIKAAIQHQINTNSSLTTLLTQLPLLLSSPDQYLVGNDYRYTYQFKDYLKEKTGSDVNMTDLSVAGYTTADLLTQVTGKEDVISAADVITISIGGNDILVAGADSGFSYINTSKFGEIQTTVQANLDETLAFIREKNPNAKILLMNFFNLYSPDEMSLDSYNLYNQADDFLKTSIGGVFQGLKEKHKLTLVDTYGLFEQVNFRDTEVSTAGTLAAQDPYKKSDYQMGTVSFFPARFIKNVATTTVKSPFLSWTDYQYDWGRLKSTAYQTSTFRPERAGVAIDLYTHFYNPNQYVFGRDESTSDLISQMKRKYWFEWFFLKGTVMDSLAPFEKWRDVHCTSLGHSLIAKAHMEAYAAGE